MEEEKGKHPEEETKQSSGKSKKILITFLVLLLLGAVGYGIWYWQQQKINGLNDKVNTLEQQLTQAQSAEDTIETINWPEYVSTSGVFRFQYKPDWLLRVCEGNERTVFIAPDEESQALCASEKGSPIFIASFDGDQRTDEPAISNYGQDISVASVTLNNIEGKKISYTHKGDEFVTKDTKFVSYEFFTGGRTYMASYSQAPGATDLLEEFEAMVQTWKFSTS